MSNLPQTITPGPAPSNAPEPASQSWFARHKILTGILCVLGLFIIIGALSGGDDTPPSAAGSTSAESTGASAEEDADSSASSLGSTADESAVEDDAEAPEPEGDDTAQEQPADQQEADHASPTLGDTVSSSDFEITVTAVETGIERVGDQYFGEEAQGQFVKVFVTVHNLGTSAEYFLDSNQKLIDELDRQHSTSSYAWLLEEENLLLTAINPGNKVEGVLLYDIPSDAEPVAVDLKAGLLGTAVRVTLAG